MGRTKASFAPEMQMKGPFSASNRKSLKTLPVGIGELSLRLPSAVICGHLRSMWWREIPDTYSNESPRSGGGDSGDRRETGAIAGFGRQSRSNFGLTGIFHLRR